MNKDRYNNELLVLGGIAAGVVVVLLVVAVLQREWDIAACLLVLQAIIAAIDNRNKARTTDRMANQLAAAPATPAEVKVVNADDEPVPTETKS